MVNGGAAPESTGRAKSEASASRSRGSVEAPAEAGTDALKRRRPRDREVMEAAIDIFWRKGYGAASVQDVADAVGMLKGSLYYYIHSKEDLLIRIFDDSHREATEIVHAVGAMDVPAVQRIELFVQRHTEWFLKHLKRASLYAREWQYLTGDFKAKVRRQRAYYDQFLIDLIKEAQADGDVPADINPVYASNFILGAINTVSDWYRTTGPDKSRVVTASYALLALNLLGVGSEVEAPKSQT
jgi:AcrR family transcriptional regulator